MPESDSDPIRKAAELVTSADADQLERRLKEDIVRSIGRLKPQIIKDIDFETDVMTGTFFTRLDPPLQGIAIARTEGALAFYNRVGWNPDFLQQPLTALIESEHIDVLVKRYHAQSLHDLAYIHPRHMEKIFGKPGAASLWESLKRFASAGA
ncbi:MAG: hypothetical protein KTR33_04220 [Gammaproteobacteria bacterium]|nr:hypothetical protein [Gammaproteobacteria bacterium]